MQLLPHSVFIMELMCWCWSDLPQHRPNFSQILQVLRSETFTNLVASAQAMESNTQITAACLHNVIANPIKNSTQKAMCPSIARIMSVIHGKSSHENETALQVWYGTENGRCEMMQFQPSGTIKKVHIIIMIALHLNLITSTLIEGKQSEPHTYGAVTISL